MVSNLLTNAARYTRPGGRIEVTAAREGDDVVLRVRDNGMGIDPALLPQMFEMFVQGERGPDRSQGGLGLGLSLVRTLTALHGGTVSAHSDGPGAAASSRCGCRRRCRARSRAARPRAEHLQIASDRAQRVLVVDDNRDGAEMISDLLVGAGHEVQVANDPSQALSLADAFRPQVAILDIGLPVMDGYTLGRELRARLGDAAPILIALTGYGQAAGQAPQRGGGVRAASREAGRRRDARSPRRCARRWRSSFMTSASSKSSEEAALISRARCAFLRWSSA